MIKEHSAGVIVYYTDRYNQRTYLLLHYLSGHWDLPKGKLENEETEQEAALRELKEETGLTTSLLPNFSQSLSYIFKNRDGALISKDVTFFIGEVNTQEIKLSSEHIGYQWLSLNEALTLLTFRNAQQLLKMGDQFINGYVKP